jgi:hypothetical protein
VSFSRVLHSHTDAHGHAHHHVMRFVISLEPQVAAAASRWCQLACPAPQCPALPAPTAQRPQRRSPWQRALRHASARKRAARERLISERGAQREGSAAPRRGRPAWTTRRAPGCERGLWLSLAQNWQAKKAQVRGAGNPLVEERDSTMSASGKCIRPLLAPCIVTLVHGQRLPQKVCPCHK